MLHQIDETKIISDALNALESMRGEELHIALDRLPAPIYVTDAEGFVTYFNPFCIKFAGRTPVVGKDRWCVTWKLYTEDGEILPHDRCPMADTLREKRPIRGVTAVAERPDGTHVKFMPYPTPLLSKEGALLGAVNMLIDLTEKRQLGELRAQAARCRRLADCTSDEQVHTTLLAMAKEYEEAARLMTAAAGSV